MLWQFTLSDIQATITSTNTVFFLNCHLRDYCAYFLHPGLLYSFYYSGEVPTYSNPYLTRLLSLLVVVFEFIVVVVVIAVISQDAGHAATANTANGRAKWLGR